MATKIKVYRLGTEPSFSSTYDVVSRRTLNYTDIVANNNKYYNIELHLAHNGTARVYTEYGRVGASNPAKEIRMAANKAEAEIIIAKIIKTKTTRKKAPYVEVQLIKSDVGSAQGKAVISASKTTVEDLKKVGVKVTTTTTSKLPLSIQQLVSNWFGSTAQFVEANLDTKKCPLGQLSINQIIKGKTILGNAHKITLQSRTDVSELNRLTSLYYSNIPHVLPHRINADLLRLDSTDKIDKAYTILDVLNDAKSVQQVLNVKSAVDSQYDSLNTELRLLDPKNPIWKWVEKMVYKTRASNHSFLGKIKIHNIFEINRNGEEEIFLSNLEKIASKCKKQTLPSMLRTLVPNRPDVSKNASDLYKWGNVLPLCHASKNENMVGLTKLGLLIRPPGVPTCGAMYGNGGYFGHFSKSANYSSCKASYWARGNSKTGYVFLCDVSCGKQKIATRSSRYTRDNIKPNHSVWAKASPGVLINDEFIVYNGAGSAQQHRMKYVIEFESNA